jgi:hypothetical protein
MKDGCWPWPIHLLEEGVHPTAPSPAGQAHMNDLAALPRNVSLMIQLDLRGIEPPKFLPLSGIPPATLQTQMPETAQIFLCASPEDARSIFHYRQIESSVGYIERMDHDRNYFQIDNTPDTDKELLMPYDPRCLLGWLSIQPGQVHKVLLSECAIMQSKPRMDQLAVYSQVHMARGAENNYTAVWFDFRKEYDINGKIGRYIEDSIPASIWQRRFACRLLGMLNEPIRHAIDFPSFLMLELLKTDIAIFEKFILLDEEPLPIATHVPVTNGLSNRLASFELTKSMIRKAEEMHRLVTHLRDPQTLELITKESHPRYKQSVYLLEMGSSLLVSEFRRQDELADKRLEVYNRFAQQRQASSLAALTYCAAFFLPLSLAGTFLSMQRRAAELHLLVYDFFGVTSIFGTLAMLIYLLSWAWYRVNKHRIATRLQKRFDPMHRAKLRRSLRVVSISAWIMTVCSFLVGMLHNLRMGLLMLAVSVAVLVFSIPCIIVTMAAVALTKEVRRNNNAWVRRNAKDDMEARRE